MSPRTRIPVRQSRARTEHRASRTTRPAPRQVERGFEIDDFRIDNVPARARKLGDLWKPLLEKRGRFELTQLL